MAKTTFTHETIDEKIFVKLSGELDRKWPNDVSIFKETFNAVNINCMNLESVSYRGFNLLANFINKFPNETSIEFSHMTEELITLFNSTNQIIADNISFLSFNIPFFSDETQEVITKHYNLYDIFDFESLSMNIPTIKDNGHVYHPAVCPIQYLRFLPESDLIRYSKYNDILTPIIILNQYKHIIYANRKAAELLETPFKRLLKRKFSFDDVINFENEHFLETKEPETITFHTCKGSHGKLNIVAKDDKATYPLRKRTLLFMSPENIEDELKDQYYLEHNSKLDTIDKLQKTKRNLMDFSEDALTDGLTGAYNYIAFTKALSKELARSIRHELSFGLVMFDIDDFKNFNDKHGHQQGNEALKLISKTVQKVLRKSDFLARYGGEEFVIIAPQTEVEGIKTMMEKCRTSIEACKIPNIDTPGQSLTLTASFGGTFIDYSRISIIYDIKTFIEQADQNLFRAKEQKKNCSVMSDYQLI